MGKKSWFSAVKKVVRSSYLKKKKEKRSHKSKASPNKSCHGYQMSLDICLPQPQAPLANPPRPDPPMEEPMPKQPENEQQTEQACPFVYPTAVAEEAADTASHADAEVNDITPSPRFVGKSREEIAPIRIQTAYRGYLARKAARPLRAERRLKLVIQGLAAKRQTQSTLMTLQTMSRVQSQVQNRKIQMSEVNEALRRQQLQRREKDLSKVKSSEGTWDLSPRSKEQVEASLKRKKEAAERREKAIAYSLSRQQTWRKSLKSANKDPNGTYWGWSWSERWDAVRPWETETTTNKESVGDKGKQVTCQSPSTSPSKSAGSKTSANNGSKSLSSMRSKRSLSVSSSPATSSYKGSTKIMKTSSVIMHPGPSPLGSGKKGISNTGSRVGSAKKRVLSLNSSPSVGKRSLAPIRTRVNTRRRTDI